MASQSAWINSKLQSLKSKLLCPLPRTRPPEPVFYPVRKLERQPVLRLIEPSTRTEVYLIGVSHGSPSSAELVRKSIEELKPSVVVLELCTDRFITICLDAGIVPWGNPIWKDAYFSTLRRIQERERALGGDGSAESPVGGPIISETRRLWSRIASAARFIRAQGLVSGVFILIGMCC